MIPNVRCVPFFTRTRSVISVDELWQLTRFDIRFKDICEIRPYKPDGTIAFSLPFVKRGGLFIWNLEVVTTSGLAAIVAVADASEAKVPVAPSLAARAAPRSTLAAATTPSRRSERVATAEPATLHRYCHGPRATEAEMARAAPLLSPPPPPPRAPVEG